jgi:hypothetical protein
MFVGDNYGIVYTTMLVEFPRRLEELEELLDCGGLPGFG